MRNAWLLLSLLMLAGCPRLKFEARPNQAPVPVVTPELRAIIGATVVLDASKTTDPEGDSLTFRWEQAAGDPVALEGATGANASFVAPSRPQKLFFRLYVSDGALEAAPAVVTVDVGLRANHPPEVRLKEQTLNPLVGATVVLDASATVDADGDPLTFRWEQVGGGADPVALKDADANVATFVAPDRAQRLFFSVTVNDGFEDATAVVQVDVRTRDNTAPVVKLKSDAVTAVVGTEVVLDASDSSDTEGDSVSFRWTQVGTAGDPVTLRDGDEAVATFLAPDRPQRLFFSVIASDGALDSPPAVVKVDVVQRANTAPVAVVAAAEIPAEVGATVVLDASGSLDAESDALSFRWTQVPGATDLVNLSNADRAVASFTAPDVAQRLYFSLIVSDGLSESAPVVVRVDVREPPNTPPQIVLAKAQLTVFPHATVVLDASGTTDAENDPLSFRWTQAGAGADPVNLQAALTSIASFTAPDRAQRLFFSVIANDGKVDSTPGVVQVDVVPVPNARPIAAVAEAELSVTTGSQVILDGRPSSDADGDALTYRWEQVSTGGTLVALTDADKAVASFRAPSTGARLFFRLTVNDGLADGDPALVGVTVYSAPEVLAIPPVFSPNQTAVDIHADAIDRDGDTIVGWSWAVKAAPSGGQSCVATPSPCLLGASTQVVSFTPPAKGDYQLEVKASDGRLWSAPVSVFVRSTNRGPTLASVTLSASRVASGTPVDVTVTGAADPDGDTVKDLVFSSSPAGLFTRTGTSTATFQPTSRGLHTITVAAIDQYGATGPGMDAALLVDNAPPTCAVGEDVVVDDGTAVALGGTAADPDRDTVTWQWKLIDYPPGGRLALADADKPVVHFTPVKKTLKTKPSECGVGDCYVLELTVSDGSATCTTSRARVVALNRPPVADAGASRVVYTPTITLDGTSSADPDGDPLTAYRWRQLLGPDVTSGTGTLSGASVTFNHQGNGIYKFELVVNDGTVDSAPAIVEITVNSTAKPPSLVLASTTDVAGEGQPFLHLDASGSTDPNGDSLSFTWTRVSGSTLWPASLEGATPVLRAPSFDRLQQEGSNAAVYEVFAEDDSPAGLRSATQRVTVYGGPGPAKYVIVSNGPLAADKVGCGTVNQPCATLKQAFLEVDPDGDKAGDGRTVIVTRGLVRGQWVSGGQVVPAGTRIVGGYDPLTYAPGGESEIRIDSACGPPNAVLELPPTATNVAVENLRLTIARGACTPYEMNAIRCDNCRATFKHVVASAVEDACISVAAVVLGASADVTFDDSELRVNRGICAYGRALHAASGATVKVNDSLLRATIPSEFVTHGIFADTARVTVKRSVIEVVGSPASGPNNYIGITATGSVISVESSVIRLLAMPGSNALSITGGTSLTMLYSTVVGAGFNTGTGAAISSTEAVNAAGNLFMDFPQGITLATTAALRSRLYANAFAPTGSVLASCSGTNVTDASLLNGASGTTCNASGASWSDNLVSRCPLVDVASGDYRLNTGVANPCIDAGKASTLAGNAPALDFEQQGRPLGAGPDIGADEAK